MCAQLILLRIYYKKETRKGLVEKISFKFYEIDSTFLRLISNHFYCPNIGSTDDRVLSLTVHKYKI
jgi:hypothetical protein